VGVAIPAGLARRLVTGTDWVEWHRPYDDPTSPLSARLRCVQSWIRRVVDAAPSGAVRVVSACAGQGRDLFGALADHPRAGDVAARLVEADPVNVEIARAAAEEAGLPGVEVVEGDASRARAYAGAVPADLVLWCGVFGNVSEPDMRWSIQHLPELCAPGATVIWTRHRRPPDLTPRIRAWFADAGFEEVGFEAPDGYVFGVGVHRLVGPARPLAAGLSFFTFTGDGARPA